MKKAQNLRKLRIRSKVKGLADRPRLSVFRSNKHIYAQIIDDTKRRTLIGVTEKELPDKDKIPGKVEKSKEIGKLIAKKAIAKKISTVVFDRGSYRYHGRVKAVAEGAREGGLKF